MLVGVEVTQAAEATLILRIHTYSMHYTSSIYMCLTNINNISRIQVTLRIEICYYYYYNYDYEPGLQWSN